MNGDLIVCSMRVCRCRPLLDLNSLTTLHYHRTNITQMALCLPHENYLQLSLCDLCDEHLSWAKRSLVRHLINYINNCNRRQHDQLERWLVLLYRIIMYSHTVNTCCLVDNADFLSADSCNASGRQSGYAISRLASEAAAAAALATNGQRVQWTRAPRLIKSASDGSQLLCCTHSLTYTYMDRATIMTNLVFGQCPSKLLEHQHQQILLHTLSRSQIDDCGSVVFCSGLFAQSMQKEIPSSRLLLFVVSASPECKDVSKQQTSKRWNVRLCWCQRARNCGLSNDHQQQ